MFFGSYSIFIYIVIFILVYNLAKFVTQNSIVRNVIILTGNLLILLTLVKEHTLIVLAILSLLVFVSGRLLQKRKSKIHLAFILTLIISLFSIRNYPFIQDLVTESFLSFVSAPILSVQKLGLSYIVFRYVHWLIESYKRNVHGSNFITFLNYIFFFPSILAGPIDTYNNFHYWLGDKRVKYHRTLFFAGITRVFIGSFKTLGIVPLVIHYATDYQNLLPDYTPLAAISISLLAYSAYIYFDFSGYSDIAIGTAYMIGVKTPENFNNPYRSKSLAEFWKRWHITFSTFLKLYVFKPFIQLYNSIFNPKYRLFITIFSYLTTFLICGLWHGDQINFVYWGLWHGVGLALNKIWTVKVKPNLNFADTNFYMLGSVLLTFVYVTVGWVFFQYSHEQLIDLFNLLV